MIDKAQADMARTLWEQSRAAAVQAHQAWDMMMKSQRAIIDSMRGAGQPFSLAADQFAKLMAFHEEQYKAALEYMEKTSKEYEKLLTQQKK